MKKELTVFLIVFAFIPLFSQPVGSFQAAGSVFGFEDEDEDEDEDEREEDAFVPAGEKDEDEKDEDERDEFSSSPVEKDRDEAEPEEDAFDDRGEEDPFLKKEEKVKDEFVRDDFQQESVKKDVFVQPIDDDFVVEKREKGKTHRYVEPDLAKIIVPTYLYTENSVSSKKLFELYKNDEVIILEESAGFMRVEFLGKEGWVPNEHIMIEKWHTYRVSMEITGGAAGGGGEIKNFDVIGNYSFRLNVAVLQDFVIGAEGRGLSFDTDVLYAGGGLMLRYYIHGLRSKKTRSALSVYAGYLAGQEKPGSTYEFEKGETQYKVFGGPYVGGQLDYYFRLWEYVALGIGGDFTFVKLYGQTETAKLEKEFFQGGGHLSLMFNILR